MPRARIKIGLRTLQAQLHADVGCACAIVHVLGKGSIEGKPMFQALDARITLRHVETRTFGNGVVLLRYQRPDAQ